MKDLATLKFWKLPIVAFGIGIICHFAFAWSMWAIALAVIFVWVAKKTTPWLYVPAALIIGWAFFTSFFPITASKVTWENLQSDLHIGQKVDSVQVKADVILEGVKNYKKDALLGQYTTLLKAGKVEKARRLLDSIDNLYAPRPQQTPAPIAEPIQPIIQPGQPNQLTQPTIQPGSPIGATGRDSVFTKGVYKIYVKGETPYNIVISPSRAGCDRYGLESPTWNYQILIPGEQPIKGDPNAKLKYYERPTFKLASQTGDTVTLRVS